MTNFNFLKYKNFFLLLSFFLILASIILVFTKGLDFGVDFKGGTTIEIRLEKKIEKSNIIAFDIAYRKSLLTIIDSNLTTLIAGIILFYLGSGPVKGFAVTLCVGLITSFFTAFTVSRLMVSKYLMANKDKIINI